jgi:hypothetical protein
LTEPELLMRAVRALCITDKLVCGELQRQVENLVGTRPKETAVLLSALAAALAATNEGFKQAERMKNAAGRR